MIPQALGGILKSRLLCRQCNSRLGSVVEGYAKQDPTIRLLVSKLARSIPRLASKLSEDQEYVASGPGGVVRGKLREGEFVVTSQKLEDGSLIQPTTFGSKSLQRVLEQAQADEVAIAGVLQAFKAAADNTWVPITETVHAIKWSIDEIRPALDGRSLDLLVPIKCAYEFLALHLGAAVYQNLPPLVAARSALSGLPVNEEHIHVERLEALEVKPIHGLLFEGNKPHAIVQIRLFGRLAFRVHFRKLSIAGPQLIYTHDLLENKEYVAKSAASSDAG